MAIFLHDCEAILNVCCPKHLTLVGEFLDTCYAPCRDPKNSRKCQSLSGSSGLICGRMLPCGNGIVWIISLGTTTDQRPCRSLPLSTKTSPFSALPPRPPSPRRAKNRFTLSFMFPLASSTLSLSPLCLLSQTPPTLVRPTGNISWGRTKNIFTVH